MSRMKKVSKSMSAKDKENFLLFMTENKWPGKRAYNRLFRAAVDGYLELDLNVPEMEGNG